SCRARWLRTEAIERDAVEVEQVMPVAAVATPVVERVQGDAGSSGGEFAGGRREVRLSTAVGRLAEPQQCSWREHPEVRLPGIAARFAVSLPARSGPAAFWPPRR